jgi:hypothetical protein
LNTFSPALQKIAEPLPRLGRYNTALVGKRIDRDIGNGLIWIDDQPVNAGLLATYAEDLTLQWGWAYGGPPGAPDIAHSRRVLEIGERHSVPELTEPLVDLSGFPDPRLASERLVLAALSLLGEGGLIKYGHGGRALTYLVTDAIELAPHDGPGGVLELEVDQPLPPPLMEATAPTLLRCLDAEYGLRGWLREKGWDRTPPQWDPAGVLRFDGLIDLRAREIGRLTDNTWTWSADEPVRTAATEHGAAHLAEDTVTLTGSRWEWIASFLGGTTEGHCAWTIPTDDGHIKVAVTEEAPTSGSLDLLAGAIEGAADILQPLVPVEHRASVMRTMVYGHFEHLGMVPHHLGEPSILLGTAGLHEVRVMIAHDGTVNNAVAGLQGTLG